MRHEKKRKLVINSSTFGYMIKSRNMCARSASKWNKQRNKQNIWYIVFTQFLLLLRRVLQMTHKEQDDDDNDNNEIIIITLLLMMLSCQHSHLVISIKHWHHFNLGKMFFANSIYKICKLERKITTYLQTKYLKST